MIVLDTNVVSEPIKPVRNQQVLDWIDRQPAETLYLTTISLAELLVGIERLPAGRRREGLTVALDDFLASLFGPRILPFDRAAAAACATLSVRARSIGRTLPLADGQIAAIASVHGFAVAARDTVPFRAAGVPVINPWEAE
jgi:hypothetical protein